MARNGSAVIENQTDDINGNIDSDDDDAPATTSKRQKVDLATLPEDEKVMVSIAVPAGMKRAMLQAGTENQKKFTAWARDVLAAKLEYTIPESFLESTRETTYASEEDRKRALAEKGKQQRAAVKDLLKNVKQNEQAIAALRASGVSDEQLQALGLITAE